MNTAQAVYRAVCDLLMDREQPGARVVLTVVHVHEPPLQGASAI